LDLDKVEGLVAEGKLYEASLDLPQLEGVVAADNQRLIALKEQIEDTGLKRAINDDKGRYDAYLASIAFDMSEPKPTDEDKAEWVCLTPQSARFGKSFRNEMGAVADDEATRWKIKIVESVSQAPEGWADRGFDAASWDKTTLPISWILNHTALLRTDFHVDDKTTLDALRIRLFTYRQQDINVFLNGVLVAKVNQASNNNTTTALLTEEALNLLKNGSNTIAVTSRSNWRWGGYMTSIERDENNSVRSNGFTMLLDGRTK